MTTVIAWEDVREAYDEGRVRCRACGVAVEQAVKCRCGTGRAVVMPRGCLFVVGERAGRRYHRPLVYRCYLCGGCDVYADTPDLKRHEQVQRGCFCDEMSHVAPLELPGVLVGWDERRG